MRVVRLGVTEDEREPYLVVAANEQMALFLGAAMLFLAGKKAQEGEPNPILTQAAIVLGRAVDRAPLPGEERGEEEETPRPPETPQPPDPEVVGWLREQMGEGA